MLTTLSQIELTCSLLSEHHRVLRTCVHALRCMCGCITFFNRDKRPAVQAENLSSIEKTPVNMHCVVVSVGLKAGGLNASCYRTLLFDPPPRLLDTYVTEV